MNIFFKNLISGIFITLLFVLLTPGFTELDMSIIATHAAVFYVSYVVVKIILWVVSKALKPIRKVGASKATASTSSTIASSAKMSSPVAKR